MMMVRGDTGLGTISPPTRNKLINQYLEHTGDGCRRQEADTTTALDQDNRLARFMRERTRGVAPTALTACGSVDERVAKARGAGMRSRASVKA